MAITVGNVQKRIGLALSGGGFRAAAFHLGVFRQLQTQGLLWKLDLLTCVSGGSIAGAFLCRHWGDDSALDRLEQYLRSASIAVSSVLGGMLDPFHTRLDKLADTYDRDLFGDCTLNALSAGPRLYLNATNLATGNLFSFVTGGGKPTEMGEWEMGFQPADAFRLSRAVAASSAFPPVFPPLRLDRSDYPADGADFICLTDGGVYDNLGVNPLLRDRNALDYVIVSDGGKPFSIVERPTETGSAVLVEAIDILMEQVRGLQFRRLELGMHLAHGPKPVWFSIDSAIGQAQDGDAAFASAISTNLKRLSAPEMVVLKRHAGALLMHRLLSYTPELLHA
ncbi:patatin-like phospholipase family protein [Sphaerotilus sp.]|uniref:patatin-like phospholipase family protein n=1 Tax=Sphaerotilus sp. TaxID=2093942 RepID=UPI00286EA42C|nr:patatin-like phospholipase family protein [Sphaerotilus sp.]